MRNTIAALLGEYGIHDVRGVRATDSEIDRTYLVDTADGVVVLKESPVGSTAALMQSALLAYVAERAPSIPLPRLFINETTGHAITETERGTAFATTFCRGIPLDETAITAGVVDDIVQIQVALLTSLYGADAASLHVPATNDWSIDAVTNYVPLIADFAPVAHTDYIHGIIHDFETLVQPELAAMPSQVIHGDFNLSNLLVADGAITGVIDFGDAVAAPRIFDVAVTACYLALALGDIDHTLVRRYVEAMTTRCALTIAEVGALRTLILSRLVIVVLLARHSARIDPERADYVLRYDRLAEDLFDRTNTVAHAAAESHTK